MTVLINITGILKKTTELGVRVCQRQCRYFSVSHRRPSEIPLYDVIVSGGGMVGAAMCAALGHDSTFEGKKILLLEGSPKKNRQQLPEKYQSRTCAISPATVDLFQSFGAWEHILNMRYQPVKRMQVWDSCSESFITFDKDNLLGDLAYIVENDIILSAVMKQVECASNDVEIRYGAKVKNYTLPSTGSDKSEPHWAQVEMESGEKLNAKLLVGADGFRSLLRETAQIHTVKWDYDQFGVVAVLNLSEKTENNVAWQRFLTTGPIALLPLSDEHSCLIWTTTPADAKNLLQMSAETFVDAVNNAFWSDDCKDSVASYANQLLDNALRTVGLAGSDTQQLPPTIINVDKQSLGAFPLGLCHASQYVRSRIALIGDAAHRLHPLAGQGVNLGFGDVACLCGQLAESVHRGSDLGSISHLLEYESQRQCSVLPVMAAVDGLNRLYGTSFSPIVLLRALGLQATNALTPIKERIIGAATS